MVIYELLVICILALMVLFKKDSDHLMVAFLGALIVAGGMFFFFTGGWLLVCLLLQLKMQLIHPAIMMTILTMLILISEGRRQGKNEK